MARRVIVAYGAGNLVQVRLHDAAGYINLVSVLMDHTIDPVVNVGRYGKRKRVMDRFFWIDGLLHDAVNEVDPLQLRIENDLVLELAQVLDVPGDLQAGIHRPRSALLNPHVLHGNFSQLLEFPFRQPLLKPVDKTVETVFGTRIYELALQLFVENAGYRAILFPEADFVKLVLRFRPETAGA